MEDIKVSDNANLIIAFFSWALTHTRKDSIHLLELGPLLHEWEKSISDSGNMEGKIV